MGETCGELRSCKTEGGREPAHSNSGGGIENGDGLEVSGDSLGAAGAQEGDDGVVGVAHSLEQRGGALFIAHVGIRARAQQRQRHVAVAVHGRQHQCRAPLEVAAVRRLPLVLQHLRGR